MGSKAYQGILIFLLVALGACSDTAADDDESNLLLQASSSGGIGYSYMNGMMEVASPELEDVNMTLEATSGYTDNARRMAQDVGDIGILALSEAYDMYHREGEFEDNDREVLSIIPAHTLDWHVIVPAASDIDTVWDLEGKVVNLQPEGSFNQELSDRIFEALEIEFTPQYLEHSEASEAMRTNSIDAHVLSGSSTAFQELALTDDIEVLSLDDETLNIFEDQLPFLNEVEFDAEQYYEDTGEIKTVNVWAVIMADKELSSELVNTIVTSVYENSDTMENYHASAQYMDDEQILEIDVPLHPGAIEYYEEVGIDIPDDLHP